MTVREQSSSSSATGIRTQELAGVRVISFDRPARRNGMDLAMFRAYYDALADADRDPSTRAVVITGEGGSFCSGATGDLLDELAGSPSARESLLAGLGHPPHLPLTLRKPLIAAVNGSAAGLGLVHALYADVRFLAEGARLSTVFSRFGLVAEYGAAWLLPRLVGLPAALDLLLSARPVDAAEALRLGLAREVLPRADVLPAAVAYAQGLAETCSPFSLAVIRRQVWTALSLAPEHAVAEAVTLMGESFVREDLAEALRAVRERRPPVFLPLP